MNPKVRAEVCISCQGRGKFSTGKTCDRCMGAGLIGTDGENEYILGEDGKGKLKIIGIRETRTSHPTESTKSTVKTKTPFRWLFLLVVVIIYIGILILNTITFKNRAVTILSSFFTCGVILMVLVYDMRLLRDLSGRIVKVFISEPDDFIKSTKKLKY